MIWDYSVYSGHKSTINCLEFSLDGFLCSGAEDKTIRVWDTKTNKTIRCIVLQDNAVTNIQFIQSFLYCSSGNKIYIFDLQVPSESNILILRDPIEIHTYECREISTFRIHPSAKFYAVADEDGEICIYNMNTKTIKKVSSRKGHTNDISSIRFRPNSLYDMVTAGYDYRVLFWDNSINFPKNQVDLSRLLSTGTSEMQVMSPPFIFHIEYLYQGKILACALGNGNIVFLNGFDGKIIHIIEDAHTNMCTLLHISRIESLQGESNEGELLISAGADYMIHGWEVKYSQNKKTKAMQMTLELKWSIIHSAKMNALCTDVNCLYVADTTCNLFVYTPPPSPH